MTHYETKSFKKEYLLDVLSLGTSETYMVEGGDFERIETNILETSRWSIDKELIFGFKSSDAPIEQFYRVWFSIGASDNRDETPFESEGDEIECINVRPRPKTVIEFVAVEKNA